MWGPRVRGANEHSNIARTLQRIDESETHRTALREPVEIDVVGLDDIAAAKPRIAECMQRGATHFARLHRGKFLERCRVELLGKARAPRMRTANLGVDRLRDAPCTLDVG